MCAYLGLFGWLVGRENWIRARWDLRGTGTVEEDVESKRGGGNESG
jgi:hypothetical protein